MYMNSNSTYTCNFTYVNFSSSTIHHLFSLMNPSIFTAISQNAIRPRKKETLFYGRMDLPRRVGRDLFFFLNFLLSGGKNDSPKKKKKIPKVWCFLKKIILEKNFRLFKKKKKNCHIFFDFDKKGWFYSFSKILKKKKTYQSGKSGVVVPVKQGFFFVALKFCGTETACTFSAKLFASQIKISKHASQLVNLHQWIILFQIRETYGNP